MNKQHRILIAVLIVQLVLIALFWTTRTGMPGVRALHALFELAPDHVTRLLIEEANSNGAPKTLELQKQDGHWRLTSLYDYPADDAKVEDFIEKLTSIHVRDALSENLKTADQLRTGDDHFDRKVTLTAGDQTSTLVFGSAKQSGSVVRLSGTPATYVAPSITLWALNASAQNFIEPRLVPMDGIKQITLQNQKGLLEMTQGEDTNWSVKGLEGQTVDQNLVKSFVSTARYLSVLEPAGKGEKPEYKLGQATLTLSDGQATATVRLGDKVPGRDDAYYAQVEGKEDVVLLSNYAAERLMNQEVSAFVQVLQPQDPDPEVPSYNNDDLLGFPAFPE